MDLLLTLVAATLLVPLAVLTVECLAALLPARRPPAGPPEVVIVIDADCRPAPGAIDRLARTAAVTGRPVQAAYTLDPPKASEESGLSSEQAKPVFSTALTRQPSVSSRLSAWAVRVK